MLVRIAGFDWTIQPAAAEMLGAGLYGQTRHATQEIVFNDTVSIGMQRLTVLHEVLHAVKESYMGNRWTDSEEDAVQQLSAGLYQVLEDNPDLCQWLWPVEEEYAFPA